MGSGSFFNREKKKLVIAPRVAALLAFVFLAVFAGCSSEPETEVAKLEVIDGDSATGLAGEELKDEVRVEVFGPTRRGLLGGKGKARPVPNVLVRFEPASPDSGLEIVGESEVMTGPDGTAAARVKLGPNFGDQYLRIFLPDHDRVEETVRLIGGVRIFGKKQEVIAGNSLPNPISLQLTGEQGQPLEGIPVYFRLASKPGKKGKLHVLQGATDSEGLASVQLETDSSATGKYEIMAEVADPERKYTTRGIIIPALALNRLGLVIGVLGGLGVFIFGMTQMSGGLQQIAGKRLKNVLHFLTKNRFAGVGAGAVVTGMIQSSSACTVMVVGFVNAGLLTLHQAIGVIYGANIGTTVTGQLISFNLKGLALPAIAVGVVFMMFGRRSAYRSFGQALLGFGFLFLGMQMMSGQLKQIAGFPSFQDFFQTFDCTPNSAGFMPIGSVLGAILIGTVMTVVVQSSSATIGLTMALASSGLINFYTAVPLILGDNIGTTVTALLASIGTNKRARQAALAHTIFNLLGTLYMIVLFYVPIKGVPAFMYIINHITAGNVFADIPENIARHVASAHTTFNVFNVIVFLPLVAMVAAICQKLVPTKDEEAEQVQKLEPHLVETPSIALRQTGEALGSMTQVAWGLVEDSYNLIWEYKSGAVKELENREDTVDRLQHEVMHYLVLVTQQPLDESQSAAVPLLMHCANDAERLGDHAMNLIALAGEVADQKQDFSGKANRELVAYFELIKQQAGCVIAGFTEDPDGNASKALKLEGEINHMLVELEQSHEKRLRKGKCKVEAGIIYVEILHDLERIADHLSNIAERLPEIASNILND